MILLNISDLSTSDQFRCSNESIDSHSDFITEERLSLEEKLKPDDNLVTGDAQQSGIDHQPL